MMYYDCPKTGDIIWLPHYVKGPAIIPLPYYSENRVTSEGNLVKAVRLVKINPRKNINRTDNELWIVGPSNKRGIIAFVSDLNASSSYLVVKEQRKGCVNCIAETATPEDIRGAFTDNKDTELFAIQHNVATQLQNLKEQGEFALLKIQIIKKQVEQDLRTFKQETVRQVLRNILRIIHSEENITHNKE